jgi:hypothetical protein
VLDQINAWREDLINLNRNNRLLYFRKTKSSTLELRQPMASELLVRLSNSRGVAFWEPPDDRSEDPGDDRHEYTTEVPELFEIAQEPREREPRPKQRARGRATRGDEIECDVAGREGLLKALRWLERRAAQEFMDKGLWVLYLGVGILDWIEQPRDTGESEKVSSPVVLIPVQLRRESAQTPYQLFRADEDAAINPALAFKLQHDFGIALPSFDDENEENIDGLLDSVREAISDQEDWSVRDTVVLSVFSFHKEVMYRDLRNNEVAVAAHPLVQALALGHRTDQGFAFEPTPEEELDEQHPPESMVSILDCDASQRQCLVAAAVGQSFVMEGPPGTGKSQTIANMIADALGHNKTVLFVSEKAAALEVVQNRLDHAGLSEFVLELHSHKATRKQVAQTLGRSLTTRLAPRDLLPEVELQRLIGHRRELTAYARAMNERREPLGKSVHGVIGELTGLQHLLQAPACDSIGTGLTAVELARIYDAADALPRSWGPVERGDDFLWRSLIDGTLTQSRRGSLLGTLERALGVLDELEGGTRALADETGLPWRSSIPDAWRFDGLLALLAIRRNVPAAWLSVQSLDLLTARRQTLETASETLRQLSELISSTAGARWRDLRGEDVRLLEESRSSLERSALGRFSAELTGSRAIALGGWLREAASLLRRGFEASNDLAAVLEVSPPRTAPELRRLLELGSLVFSPHKPSGAWLDAAKLPEVRVAVDALEPLVDKVKVSLASVETLFNAAILDIDGEGLQVRFDQVHHGFGKLRLAYWRDKRTVRELSKSGKVRREERSGLKEAAGCKKQQRELAACESRHAAAIGPDYYRSLDSDFNSTRSALGVADSVLRLAAGQSGKEALARRFSPQADLAGEVVRALSGTQQWTEQFAATAASLGTTFERLLAERPMSELIPDCEAAAADMERIGDVLARAARVVGADNVSLDDTVEWLRTWTRIEQIESEFIKDERFDRELLGPTYIGPLTDFQALAEDLAWTGKIRDLVGRPLSSEVAASVLRLDIDQYAPLRTLLAEWSQLEATVLGQFDQDHRSETRAEFETPFSEVKSLLDALARSIDDISEWGAYAAAIEALGTRGLESPVRFCIQKRVAANELSFVLRRSTLESWVDAIRKNDQRLRMFLSKDRDHVADSFKELDRRFVQVAAAKVIETCNAKRPIMGAGAAGLIAAEANKQRRHMPIRRLIEQAAPVVQALKPCMMMSPLSVSQFLPPTMRFDLVIFDEASQVKPADAINCVYRGRQLVIAGDQKQLPPTPFFDKLDSDSGDEWEEEQIEEYESVLDVAKGSGALRAMALRWHYRSQHEDLITYSNYSFYDGQLITFPSANIHGPDVGVELIVVPGVYRRGGGRDNPIEAAKVVERVLFHVREHPHLSIGVVAFSEAQASTIENEIVRCSEESPELRVMLDGDRLHGGFVKNLESVQGDERDIIIFSIGYGRDEAGRFTLQFGPLNKLGGHRRLNVAITRARRRVEVVSSIEASDFVGDLRSDGVRHLRRYLDFAARSENRLAALGVELGPSGRDSESPFEEEVARVVRSWGYDVVPQVGCADYRIDMAVKHPAQLGRYALGIECDGAMYHSSRVARDRDRLRQEVLARLGWTNLHRIWGLSWYWNRGQEEVRLRRAIERAIEGRSNIEPARAIAHSEPEELSIALSETPAWVVPYVVVMPGRPRTAVAIHEGSAQSDIQRMILEVVSGEGPVATEVVLQRVRERWGLNRAGSRARSAFDTALRAVRRRGEVVSESDGFLALPSQSTPLVRAGDQSDPETIRTIHEIPPSELKEAIVRFVRQVHSITENELTARLSSVFGWNRRGSDIAAEMRKVIKRLVAAGTLKRTGDVLLFGDDAV